MSQFALKHREVKMDKPGVKCEDGQADELSSSDLSAAKTARDIATLQTSGEGFGTRNVVTSGECDETRNIVTSGEGDGTWNVVTSGADVETQKVASSRESVSDETANVVSSEEGVAGNTPTKDGEGGPVAAQPSTHQSELSSKSVNSGLTTANVYVPDDKRFNSDDPMDSEEILQLLGRYGRYQFLIFALISFVTLRGVWHLFGPIFLGADPGHYCRIPANSTVNDGIPYKEKDGEFSLAQCEMYIPGHSNQTVHSNQTQPCQDGWQYGDSYESTVLTEWDLVCDRAYLSDLGTSIFMAGMIVGSLCISPLSDKFGRKRVLLGALWLQGILGIATAFVNDYVVFMVMRFFIGALNQTIGLVAYVMVPEAFPASSRTMPYIALFLFWSGGIMSLALLGYLIRNWRYLEVAISIPSFLTVAYYWILPESIPWLMAKHKYSEAEAVIRKAAKLNHVTLPDEVWNLSNAQTSNGLLPVNSENGDIHKGSQDLDVRSDNRKNLVSEVGFSNGKKISELKHGSQDLSSTGCDTVIVEGDNSNGVQYETLQNGTRNENGDASRDRFKIVNTPSSTVADNCTKSISLTGYHKHSDQYPNKRLDGSISQDEPRSYNIIDLFRTPKIRIYSLITFYLWLVNSLSYFGISFSVPVLHGDTFLNLFISGAVEIPAYLICMATVECLGRRRPLSAFMLVCGVASIIAIFIPTATDSGVNLTPLKTTMAMISKFGITGAYVTVYLFCLEIYPTVVRNLGVGIAAAFETIGGVAAPFIASSAKTIPKLPLTVFGVLTIVGGLLCLVLPETHRKRLPETIEEVEGWDKQTGELQQGR